MSISNASRRWSSLVWLLSAATIALSVLAALAVSTRDPSLAVATWKPFAIVAVPVTLGTIWILETLGSGHVLGIRSGGAHAPTARAIRPLAAAQILRLLIIPLATALAIEIMRSVPLSAAAA